MAKMIAFDQEAREAIAPRCFEIGPGGKSYAGSQGDGT